MGIDPALERSRSHPRPDHARPRRADFANGQAPRRSLHRLPGRVWRTLNAADFGDLLLHTTEILRTPAGRCWPSITACSATSWSTNTRTPTWSSISGYACWRRIPPQHLLRRRRRPEHLLVARRRGGKHPPLRDAISPAPEDRPPGKPTIARPRRSSAAAAGADRPQRRPARENPSLPGEKMPAAIKVRGPVAFWDSDEEGPHGRRAASPDPACRRAMQAVRDRHPGTRRLPDPRLRGAADHPRHSRTGSSAACVSTSVQEIRDAIAYHARHREPAQPTTWPSSASSTSRAAASARPRCAASARDSPGWSSVPLTQAATELLVGSRAA